MENFKHKLLGCGLTAMLGSTFDVFYHATTEGKNGLKTFSHQYIYWVKDSFLLSIFLLVGGRFSRISRWFLLGILCMLPVFCEFLLYRLFVPFVGISLLRQDLYNFYFYCLLAGRLVLL